MSTSTSQGVKMRSILKEAIVSACSLRLINSGRQVTGITKFGAFVELPGGKTGMVHISEVAPTFVKEIRDYVTENQTVKVKVLSIGDDGKVSLSMKKAVDPPAQRRPREQRTAGRPGGYEWQSRRNEGASFEDMMSRFKQTSDEKDVRSQAGDGRQARRLQPARWRKSVQ